MDQELTSANYVLLGTQKRDGSMVNTPVWFSMMDNNLYAFSADNAGKIKRLKNFSNVTLAPCSVNGKIRGKVINAEGFILNDPQEIQTAYQELLNRYGWQMRLLNLGSRIAGKINKRAFIKVCL